MFVNEDDFGNVIYGYQVEQITDGNDDILLQALAAGIEETRSYLEINTNRHDSMDGRLIYDVVAIFSAIGTDRNALILQHTLTIAKWHLVQLCNADIIYEQAKERYDRAITWLRQLSKGDITMSSLPLLAQTPDNDNSRKPFSYGSRKKFRYE